MRPLPLRGASDESDAAILNRQRVQLDFKRPNTNGVSDRGPEFTRQAGTRMPPRRKPNPAGWITVLSDAQAIPATRRLLLMGAGRSSSPTTLAVLTASSIALCTIIEACRRAKQGDRRRQHHRQHVFKVLNSFVVHWRRTSDDDVHGASDLGRQKAKKKDG